jgi:hypothetical protein
MGNIKIELQAYSVSDGRTEPVSFDDAIDVLPGMNVSKIVQVKNIGGQPAWIRIAVDKSIQLADGVSGAIDLSLITYDLNTEHWTEKDGYYYYMSVLKPGETTEPLFTSLSFSPYMSNMYQQSKAYLEIHAQATQVANNGANVYEAAGWPKSE